MPSEGILMAEALRHESTGRFAGPWDVMAGEGQFPDEAALHTESRAPDGRKMACTVFVDFTKYESNPEQTIAGAALDVELTLQNLISGETEAKLKRSCG